jgi:hypothetical protein
MRTAAARLALLLLLLSSVMGAGEARGYDFLEGRVQVHGYLESQFRSMSDGFRDDRWFVSQWAQVLTLEIDAELIRDGLGPIDSVGLFVKGQARFDCIWSRLCGTMRSAQLFGNRSNKAPGNLANGVTSNFTGVTEFAPAPTRAQNDNNNLVTLDKVPPVSTLLSFGAGNFFQTIAPVADGLYTVKRYQGSIEPQNLGLGPWQPRTHISSIGTLAGIDNPTGPSPDGLPLRPKVPNDPSLGLGQAHNLYVPSQALLGRMDDFDSFDQNFTQSQLQWNLGASQEQTKQLKEAYLDIEALEGRLFLRVGLQTIVWGKTELFPVVDQFNPYDFALTSLPSLEESRTALWSARAIYSLYDVGPLEDVRVEVAANLDRYQPNDIGKCGEPYTAWLVCGKSFGLLIHGLLGLGLAGEQRPPDFWENSRGLEFGGRLEFRWDRFSFALTDFYGYSDFPFVDKFNEYSRKVDPSTGMPLAVDGTPLTPENALAKHPANRQLFDFICSSSGGLAATIIPALEKECFLDLFNSDTPIPGQLFLTVPLVLGTALAGTNTGQVVVSSIAGVPVSLTRLNWDPGDGPRPSFPSTGRDSLSTFLTPQQQGLLGCGPSYGTNCDQNGIDLFNAEASVLLQAFPQFEDGGPVATRFLEQRQGPVATRYAGGQVITLPGARTIYDPAWDPLQDGCVGNAATITAARAAVGLGPGNAALCNQFNPDIGNPGVKRDLFALGYTSELQTLSANFLKIVAAFSASQPGCDVNQPTTCSFVRGIFQAAGTQRPEAIAGGNGRFGRRDFAWSSGSEAAIKYRQRNVLGFSGDFPEDVTKTNWSFELTWVRKDTFENSMERRGYSFADAYNLTLSVDRPTFINFLNHGRTFFFNMQWFLGWVPDYQGQGRFTTNGPYSQLGTFTVQTGYFQDRLLPSVTVVHDVGSNSGAILGQITYRFTEAFSSTVGISNFYGTPQFGRVPLRQIGLQNSGGNFMERFRFQGLSAIAERDEIFATLRYTF